MSINAPRDYADPAAMFSVDELPFGTGELILEALDAQYALLDVMVVAAMTAGDRHREAHLHNRQQHIIAAKQTFIDLMDDSAERQGFVPTAYELWEMEEERRGDEMRENAE